MQGRSYRPPADPGAPRGSSLVRGRAARGVMAILARAVALAATGLLAGAPAPPAAADIPDNVIVNGHFDTGNFTGWNVGIRPDRANGGSPYLFSSPSGWVVSKDPQSDGSLSLNPINGFSAFNGFEGNPAGLQFFLNQPFTFNSLLHDAILTFTFDIVGGPQSAGAKARTFEVVVTSMSGHDRAKLFSYSVPGADTNPKKTVTLDIRSALNSLGPAVYMLEFRENVPEGSTGPAIFALDDVSLELRQNCAPKPTCPPNQVIDCPGPVTLQGSAFDLEDDPLTFLWTEGNTVLGTGPKITVQLAPGKHTIKLTVSDILGGMDMCEFTVTIMDTKPPVIQCPANIDVCTDPGECTATLTLPPTTATDECPGTPTVVCKIGDTVITSPHTFPRGTTTVTCTATDAAGNQSTCSYTVKVSDCQPPTIKCPDNILIVNNRGECGTIVRYNNPVVTDNCPEGELSVTCDPPSGSFFTLGPHTVTCTAMDAAGNKATCTFTITVRDSEEPVITCPANITVPNTPGLCSAVVNYTATATDNCPGVTLTCNPPPGSVFPVGTTTVTCTATDTTGNTATCSFTVTVNDTQNPTITCPANITVPNDPNVCDARVTFNAGASDNCPGVTVVCRDQTGKIVQSGDRFPIGTTTVTCTATDAAGNSASCSFTITVTGSVIPRITCPSNFTVTTAPGQCSAVVNYTATVESCTPFTLVCTPPSGTVLPVGTHTITCTATNAAGTATCTFTVTVRDLVPPTITCPNNLIVESESKRCGAFVRLPLPTATDDCPGPVRVVCSPPSGSFFPVGTTTVTCTATDAGGNTATCTFTVTVIDTDMPKPLCPEKVIVRNIEAGTCGARLNFEVPVWTNCPDATLVCRDQTGRVVDSDSLFQAGTHTITCTATDTAGNSFTCSFTLLVNDWQKPAIICPGDITEFVPATATEKSIALPDPVVTDNCPGATVTCERSDGLALTAPFRVGTTIVTCTATDASGNIQRCFYRVHVKVQTGG